MSPPTGFGGMDERLSRWPVAEAVGELFDGIVESLYLRLKTLQSFLDPCSFGIAAWSCGPVHAEGSCPASHNLTRG